MTNALAAMYDAPEQQRREYHHRQTIVLLDVIIERGNRERKWGQQNHNPLEWLAVLTEEVGEAAQEALRMHFGGKDGESWRGELVQVAASAIAAIECYDRLKAAQDREAEYGETATDGH